MIVIYDLETLKDFFLYVDLQVKEDIFNVFEISRFKNESKELLAHLKTLQGQIGFNNLAFDSQVQQDFIKCFHKLKDQPGEQVAQFLAEIANSTVEKSNGNEFPKYWERDLSVRQVDLFRIWHYNNKSKITGLKWLQYMMDWTNIEDMPIGHNDFVDTREKADMIISYCKNDCLSTKRFYEITRGQTSHPLYKGIDRLQLRKDIKKEFGFDCTNYDDVKIGDKINKVNYLKATGLEYKDLKDKRSVMGSFTFGDCFPEYTNFISTPLITFIDSIKDTPILIDSKQEFSVKIGNTTHTLAKGGIHSQDSPRLILPTVDQILRDADVGSQYPNSIRKRRTFPRHLEEKWLDGYTSVIEKRMNAKKMFKETKDPKYQSIQEAFKYSLNGGSFGKFGEKTNWQYDPFCGYKTTIGNQIEILMLIERLYLTGIDVISSNTDGIVCLFDKAMEPTYNRICKEWEKIVGNEDLGQLEFADYKLLAQRSVNDYIAIKTDGKAKHKGASFSVDHELHKNKSFRIIALALEAYFVQGLNPRKFIMEHGNIFDFCAGVKMKGDWFLQSIILDKDKMVKERLQKTNRYFISNNGVKLVKCNPDGREIRPDAGEWKFTIYNKHVEKPIKDYDINYNFYVGKTYEIISEIQPEVLNEHFTQLSMF